MKWSKMLTVIVIAFFVLGSLGLAQNGNGPEVAEEETPVPATPSPAPPTPAPPTPKPPPPAPPVTEVVAAAPAPAYSLDSSPADFPTHLVRVLRTSNKAQVNRYVAKVYDFKNVNPNQVVNYFGSAVSREEGGVYTFVEPDGVGGKLMVFCPKYQIAYFDKLAQELDRPELTSAPGSKYIYYHLRNRNATDPDFINLLVEYISPHGFIAGKVVNTGHVVASDVETNSVLLFDSPSGAAYAEKILKETLDVPTPQVNVNLKIYEIALNNDGTLGLDFESWKNGPGQRMFWLMASGRNLKVQAGRAVLGTAAEPLTRHISYRDWFHGAGYYLDYPSAFFDFLVEKGKAKVLTETKLTACTSKAALFYTGDQILYFRKTVDADDFARTVTGNKTSRATPAEPALGIEASNTGILLLVAPTVGLEDINLQVYAEAVSHLGFAEDGSPLLSARKIEDEFRVKNGQELMIGGLSVDQRIQTTRKIPVLGSLPVIGYLFGGEITTMKKSMVVMVLQPNVVTDFSGMVAADTETVNKATGKEPIKLPDPKIGFDQYLLSEN